MPAAGVFAWPADDSLAVVSAARPALAARKARRSNPFSVDAGVSFFDLSLMQTVSGLATAGSKPQPIKLVCINSRAVGWPGAMCRPVMSASCAVELFDMQVLILFQPAAIWVVRPARLSCCLQQGEYT